MKKKILWIVGVIIIIVLIVVFVRARGAEEKSVKIGNILYITGPLAALGEQELNGMKIAEADINAAGGVKGKPVEIVTQDFASDPKQAVPAYQALKQQGIKFFLIEGGSSVAPLVPLIRQNDEFSMVPVAITTSYFDDVARTCRVALTAKDFARGIGDYLVKKFAKPRVAFLVTGNEYGKTIQGAIESYINKVGGTIVTVETYDQSATDFRTQIIKLKALQDNTDALVVINASNSVEAMFRQIKQLGYTKLIAADTFTILNASLKDLSVANGAVFVGYPFGMEPQESDSAVLAHFKQEYYAKHKSYPSSGAVNAYDAVMVTAYGMNHASALTPAAVAEYITKSMGEYQAVGGTFKFDTSCEVSRKAVMRQVVDGKLQVVE